MEHLILFLFIVLIASSIQSGTGFGFSILSTPFLLFLFKPHEAILINIACSLLLSVLMAVKLRKSIDKDLLYQLSKGSAFGFVPGLLLFIFLEIQPLKIVISTLILLSSIVLLFPFRVNITKSKSIVVGGFSGFLTSSIGIPGPPLLIYFSAAEIGKDVIRATTLCFFILVYSIALALHIFFNSISDGILPNLIIAAPFVVIGSFLGDYVFTNVDGRKFHRILYLILAMMGISLLISTLIYPH